MDRFRKTRHRTGWGLVLLIGIMACSSPKRAPAPPGPLGLGHLMLGTWQIWATTGGGPNLEITIDVAEGDRYSGRVTHAFAGDVGDDLTSFAPFDGAVAPDSTTRILIERRGSATPAWEMVVRPVGDSLEVSRYVWEGEDQQALGRQWTGRRRP